MNDVPSLEEQIAALSSTVELRRELHQLYLFEEGSKIVPEEEGNNYHLVKRGQAIAIRLFRDDELRSTLNDPLLGLLATELSDFVISRRPVGITIHQPKQKDTVPIRKLDRKEMTMRCFFLELLNARTFSRDREYLERISTCLDYVMYEKGMREILLNVMEDYQSSPFSRKQIYALLVGMYNTFSQEFPEGSLDVVGDFFKKIAQRSVDPSEYTRDERRKKTSLKLMGFSNIAESLEERPLFEIGLPFKEKAEKERRKKNFERKIKCFNWLADRMTQALGTPLVPNTFSWHKLALFPERNIDSVSDEEVVRRMYHWLELDPKQSDFAREVLSGKANFDPHHLLETSLERRVTERGKSLVKRLCKQGTKHYRRHFDYNVAEALREGRQVTVNPIDYPVNARTASNCIRILLSGEYNCSVGEDGTKEIDEEKVLECGRVHGKDKGSHYLVRRRLGEGKYGKTYEAYNEELEASRAVKILSKKTDEAKVMAKLVGKTVENVVAVHDAGENFFTNDGQRCFAVVMDYLKGETLETILGRGGIPLFSDVKKYSLGILNGLRELYEVNITHRDIHPGNIVIEQNSGRPVIIDFGSAVVMNGSYPPDPKDCRRYGGFDDIFSFGLMMYRIVKGKHLLVDYAESLSEEERAQRPEFRDYQAGMATTTNADWIGVNKDIMLTNSGELKGEFSEFIRRRLMTVLSPAFYFQFTEPLLRSLGVLGCINNCLPEKQKITLSELKEGKKLEYDQIREVRRNLLGELYSSLNGE